MKKIIFTLSIALLAATTLTAQKKSNFQGSVTYSISFDGAGLPPEALEMLKGAEATTTIKADKRKVDMNMPMQSTTVFIDNKSKDIVTLMDIMGQKYLIRMNEKDIKKEEDDAPKTSIKYLDETKEIAGYKCKKAEVTTKTKSGEEDVSIVFYTTEIPTSELKAAYKGLNGFPLEYSLNQGGIKMMFTAKNISKEEIKDSSFEIPKEGYTETTMADFQKTMSKMTGQ
jgi:GLPGLI family protein